MDIFGAIGNLLGGLFGGGQKKKQEQNQPQVATVRPPSTPVVNQNAPTVRIPQPFALPSAPTAPVLGGVTQGGLSPETKALQAKAAYENSPLGLVLNTAGQVGRTLAGGAVDAANFVSRVPETVQAAGDSVNIAGNNLLHMDNRAAVAKALADQQGAKQAHAALGNLTNAISGGNTQTNDETNREAQQISTGNYSGGGNAAGDIFSALTKSLGAASSLPIIGGAKNAVVSGVKDAGGELLSTGDTAAAKAAFRDPSSPITTSPTTSKPPAITSANRPAPVAPTVQPPRPLVTAPEAIAPPVVRAPAPVPAAADQGIAIAPTPFDAPEVPPVVAPTSKVDVQTAAPTAPSTLGTITRDAVRDGSIKTPEGIDKVVADTTAAAHRDAGAAGDKLENIIKKGQQAYEDSKTAGHDLTPKEVLEKQPSFTSAQQEVYKNYAQELSTLRDRSGHSLKGGNQGQWYAPRQFLSDEGASQAYDPALVNELKRTGAKTDSNGNALDYSATPFEHYIRRYSDAGNAATERMVNAVEHDEQGVESGIKIPGEAKDNLNKAMSDIADKRDQIDQLKAAGDEEGAKALHAVVQKDTRQAFSKFTNDIPKGPGRQAAINRVKSMRDTYETTLSQTLTTSNLVNRVADQGTKAVEAVKRPLVQGLKKVVGGKYKTIAKSTGADAFDLNTSRAATKAASQFSRGTLGREIIDNAKTVISQAGAGRNPLVKGIAKVDATVRAAGGSLLEAGDLSTPNVREALQIGASRPEAQGLKTVADYKKYFNDYTKTSKFKDDLATVQEMQNPKVGLAGGEVQKSGKISNFLSREVDNVLSTNADRIKPGLGKNRIVREANDFVKGNVTGYAGVTSRVLGTVRDAAVPVVPLRRAAAQAASGDPAAVARATTTAAHAVADSIALYGTAGAAATLGATKVIGYTGAQPVQGSSASAYNKDNNVPANQWFLNLPGGKRLYFDPARPAGGPGVAADIAGSVLSGSNPLIAGENIATQISNQAGGNSLPQDVVNVQNALSPSASDADKKYALQQLQATAAPATGILNNIANFTDPTKRAPKNFVDDLKSNLPDIGPVKMRSSTPAAKTAAGDPIANSKQLSGGSGLFSVADNPDAPAKAGADPVASEVTRLHNAGIDVTPTTANTNASQDNVKSLSSALLKDPIYVSADDKTKAAYLKTVLDGTSTKKIDPSLSSTDKQALLDGTILGDKKGAWLDDNKNNASYTQATYDNAKASGTLTAAQDDITKSGSLKYQAVAAKVDAKYGTDQQLRDDYSGTSQSDFTALLNPKSPDYDLAKAQKVYNYDKARTDAGLPAKYDLDKAQKTGAYASTGGAGKNFSFANLPSSLVGTGSSSSNGGYASDAPLFKPIASLQAPVGAAIPNGRTISVKKGVAL